MKQYLNQLIKVANPVISIIISIIMASVLTIVDYFDLISKFFTILNKPYVIFLFISVILIFLLCILYIRPFSQFKIKSITNFDLVFYRLELALLLYLISSLTFCGYNWVKTGLLIGSIVVIFICLLIRYISFFKALKIVTNNENRIIDLKKVFENNLPKDKSLPIFIDEKDVDYDLLDRQPIINKLVSSIKNYNTEGSYVIGLVGSWGSGKTTVINNAKTIIRKENNKTIVIDEFDPWLYENQDALLAAMVDTIMNETGIKYSFKNLKKVCNIIKEVIGLAEEGEIFAKALSVIVPKDDNYLGDIKDKINNFLSMNDKYVVVIIDNIERATAENVIFLFKLIGTLFDIKRITYVLSYDKERLTKIFEDTKKIDCHYIEKIVQQEITVPTIQESKCSKIYSTCFCNLLEFYNVSQSDMPNFKFILDYLANDIKDLRTFKRLINSTFSIVFTEDNYLYKPDLLSLEFIRFIDSELYYAIYKNRRFFISHDRLNDDSEMVFSFFNDEFNEKGKEFLNGLLFNRNKGIKDLLASIFPYVKRFLHDNDLIPKDSYGDSEYSKIQLNGRACSAKYFDLYFCYGANEYLAIKEDVKDFVSVCNSNIPLTDQLLFERLLKINLDFQEEWFSMLQFHLSEISEDNLLTIIKFLTININEIDNAGAFLSVNALQRVTYLIYNVLKSCSEINFNSYIRFMDKRFNRLRLVEHLCSHFEHEPNVVAVKTKMQKMKELLEKLCEEIILNNIDLYDDKYYRIKNSLALYRFLEKRSDLISFQEYILKVINAKTIIRLLGDTLVESISNTHNYYISKDLYALYFGDKDIEEIVNDAEITTDSQGFVKQVYQNYLFGTENDLGEKPVSCLQPVRLSL